MTNKPANNYKEVEEVKEYKEKRYIKLSFDGDSSLLLNMYLNIFQEYKGKEHMQVTEEQKERIKSVLDKLEERKIDYEEFEYAVYEHFDTLPQSNNGNILAFLPATERYFHHDNE